MSPNNRQCAARIGGNFSTLDLPRELRDKIYRELLTPEIGNQRRSSYKITPAVISVNRQTNEEASTILYGENCWVVLMIEHEHNCEIEGSLEVLDAPLIRLNGSEIIIKRTPSIEMSILMEGQHPRRPAHTVQLIVSAYDMPRLLHCITKNYAYLKLHVTVLKSVSAENQHRERIIDALCDMRRAASASIVRLQPSGLATRITNLMMSGERPIQDVIEHMAGYQRRGDRAASVGNLEEAAMIYKDGYRYTEWGYREDGIFVLTGVNDNTTQKFDSQKTALQAEHAFCAVKLGCPETALAILNNIPLIQNLPRGQQATVYYYQGLAHMSVNHTDKALMCFFQALIQRPGHQDVNDEIDAFEERLKDSLDEDSRLVKRIFIEAFDPYRRQEA